MIHDLDNNRIVNYSLSVPAEHFAIAYVKVRAEESFYLSSTSSGALAIEARKTGDATWVDIESGSIDLTPYAPSMVTFEIRITAGTSTGFYHFKLKVTKNA